MTRRVWTYPNLPGWGLLNMISTVGAFILGGSMLLLAAVQPVSQPASTARAAGDNPWQAWTLDMGHHVAARLPTTLQRYRPYTAAVLCGTSIIRTKRTGCREDQP